jgi:hypothetical protein
MTPEEATIAVLHDAILRLKAQLATSRRDAYEDAAKIAEDCESEYGGYQCDVAAAIRSRTSEDAK